jgi:DNA-directed RNA polymerase subunit K/omega
MGGDAAAVQPRISPAPPARAHQGSAVNRAIEEVNHVVELLQRALEEMEEVLETLEFAERQKIDDEREIDSLRRALRQLHRPKEEERAQ